MSDWLPENRPANRFSSLLDLARSAAGLSWSLALLGADAASRLLGLSNAPPAAGLDAVRHAAEGELDVSLRGVYRAGERVQQRILDGFQPAAPRPDHRPPPAAQRPERDA